MSSHFNELLESKLLSFIQDHYGLEVFTPGLLRTRKLYLPFVEEFKKKGMKVVTIAGTNGKGQTAHTLAHYLKAEGHTYALWTSPHILSLRERFSFNEGDVSYTELEKEIEETHQNLKENMETKISFYEFLFLVFLRLAQKRNCAYLILEVGLGGKLDAVNHFDANCAAITSISRDHQAILGNRFDLILKEKIAVSRRGKPLFTQFHLQYLNEMTKSFCESSGVLWRPLEKKENFGNYFLENQKMAQALYTELTGRVADLSLELLPFKGRREEMTFRGNSLIFIGAHNIDGVRKMIELMKEDVSDFWPSSVVMSFSKRPHDEIEVMAKAMVNFFGKKTKIRLTTFEHPKAAEETILFELLKKINRENKGQMDFVTDWKADLNLYQEEKILICGSYYFVGEVQRFILSHS